MSVFVWAKRLLAASFCACSIMNPFGALAQQDDRNIIIEEAAEDIRFVGAKGDDGAVKVEQALSTTYLCQDYRTSIKVAEHYNDETKIDEVKVFTDGRRNREIEPQYDYFGSEDVFYTDTRICHINLPFEKKGSAVKVAFDKTIRNPIFLTKVFFADDYPIKKKTVTISIPDWMTVELKQMNFEGWHIAHTTQERHGNTIHTFTLNDAPPLKQELNAPGSTYFAPHLLILTKESKLNGITKTYFKTLGDQYNWYHSLVDSIGNDEHTVKQKAVEVIAGKTDDYAKVRALYNWVQQNIRYIAYEDGIAGFKPKKAQEVMQKKYGDCKGMANLLKVMLQSVGYDARLCWLGTNHLAYNYSTPSLCVDNHMIAAWMYKGRPVFLDGTEKYLDFTETAERIQGRQVLVENGTGYLLETIPLLGYSQNTSVEQRTLTLEGQDLRGRVTHTLKGENKEAILNLLDAVPIDKREETLRLYLSQGQAGYVISNLKTSDLKDYSRDLTIDYDLLHKGALTKFGADQYLDLDNRRKFAEYAIDTVKHHLPYVVPFKDHQVLDIKISLPDGARVKNLPAAVELSKEAYGYNGKWIQNGKELSYHTENWLGKTYFPVAQFSTINKDVQAMKRFYNAQPELSFN